MRVLVCGGRAFVNRRFLAATLDKFHAEHHFTMLIEGDAPGVDRMSNDWAKARGLETKTFRANWEHEGRAAGPIRNKRMLEVGKPELVIAFDGGRGTDNMVQLARNAGVPVIEVSEQPAPV